MDSLQAFNILEGRARLESRILLERLSLLVVANSVLMMAFFLAVPTIYFRWMRYALPTLGIMLCVAFGVLLWAGANAAVKLYDALCRIEEDPDFAYMKNRQIRPHTDLAGIKAGCKHMWKFGHRMSPFFGVPVMAVWIICMALPYA
jgi:hypothetical protein